MPKLCKLCNELLPDNEVFNYHGYNSDCPKPTKTISERLRLKASVIAMGEKIAWGSDTALMLEAADTIELLKAKIYTLEHPKE